MEQREIKFKYVFQHEDTGNIVTRIFTIEEVENALLVEDYRRYSIVARLQYTGLKDRNGKEIYEADIVKTTGLKPHLPLESFVAEVKWDKSYACWWPNLLNQWEVIGNVFENPELLSTLTH